MLLLLRTNILALDFNGAMAFMCAINGGECDYGAPAAADGAAKTASGIARPRLPIVEDIVRLALRLTRLTAAVRFLLCTVIFYANLAHSLTRSP